MRVVINTNINTSKINDEMVILDRSTEKFFGLNRVAVVMWNAVQAHATMEEALEQITQHYPDVPQNVLHQDLLELLHQLENLGLVELHEN